MTSIEQAFQDNFQSRIITIRISMKHCTQYIAYFQCSNLPKSDLLLFLVILIINLLLNMEPYRYPILELYLYFEIYTAPERTGTLLCSVALENKLQVFLHQKLFHLLLVTSVPREHAEMVQLLMVESLNLFSVTETTEYLSFR